jgi:putative acetyltransferase
MPSEHITISVRRVRAGEEFSLWQIFYASVHEVACSHYTPEQLNAWAPDHYSGVPWVTRIQKNQPFVAELNGRLAGFADVQPNGYIDHFFVAGFAARKGVGTKLMQELHITAATMQLERLCSEVSLSAQQFFSRAGFKVEADQTVIRNGIELRNSRMFKDTLNQPKTDRLEAESSSDGCNGRLR